MTGVPSKHVVVLENCGPVDIFVEVGLLTFVTFVTWSCNYLTVVVTGGGRFVKKTSRKYNFPLMKNNLRHYFYFLPVRVFNILRF